jgi:hypothetical protein
MKQMKPGLVLTVLACMILGFYAWQAQARDRAFTQEISAAQADEATLQGTESTAAGPFARLYTGTSDTGSFQEALDIAIANASQQICPDCSDYRVEWRLNSVTGRQGGFSFVNEVTVAIHAR